MVIQCGKNTRRKIKIGLTNVNPNGIMSIERKR